MLLSLRPAGTQYFGGRLRNNRSFCAELVGGPVAYGGGCWHAGRIFSTEPFAWGLSQTTTGGQGRVLAGVASDDVARLRLFTATGRSARVPLRDNAYFVTFEAGELPVRLVAYDRAGLVIGVKELYPPGVPGVAPSATATASMVVATKAGSAWIQRSHGTTCLGFLVRGGPSGGITCNHGTLPALPSHALAVQLSSTVDRPGVLGVTGRVGRGIATVRLVYKDGRASRLTPVGGYVIATVPAGGVGTAGVGAILGLDEAGRTVAVEELAH
jgi:hypothetical protein